MATNAGLSIGTTINASPGGAVTHQVPAVPVAFVDHQVYLSVYEFVVPGSSPPVQVTGNGTTDDSGAIQAALNACNATGRTLYFPAGNYLVNAGTTILNPGVPVVFGPGANVSGTQANALLNQGAQPYYVRAVMTTVATSTTYTGSGTNTITFGSNAAIGTQDGITTLAVGDCVLLQGGTLGSCAITAADIGPWIISNKGSASAKVVLTRPSWWQTGAVIPLGAQIKVGIEGSLFGGGYWTSWVAAGKLVGTDDPVMYPDMVSTQVTLASSANVLATIPFRSATLTTINCTLAAVGGTTTSTVGYGPIAALTAGYIGTCTVTIVAQASGMTKNGTSDTSIVSVLVCNRSG